MTARRSTEHSKVEWGEGKSSQRYSRGLLLCYIASMSRLRRERREEVNEEISPRAVSLPAGLSNMKEGRNMKR